MYIQSIKAFNGPTREVGFEPLGYTWGVHTKTIPYYDCKNNILSTVSVVTM